MLTLFWVIVSKSNCPSYTGIQTKIHFFILSMPNTATKVKAAKKARMN